METPTVLKCPECGSSRVFRNGTATSSFDAKIQRYVCRICGRRFSDSDDLKRAKEVANNYLPTSINVLDSNNRLSQVCDWRSKNLTLETLSLIHI